MFFKTLSHASLNYQLIQSIVFLILFLKIIRFTIVNGSYVDEENILNLILKNYGVDVRPQIKPRTPVYVKFDVRLKSLNYLVCKIYGCHSFI